MAMQPDVLILDEPASQLDPIAATDFLNTIHKINRDLGTTIIISEHRLEEVFPMANKVVVMDEGKVLTSGTPQKVATELFSMNESGPHPMFFGMPHVVRIFTGTDFVSEEEIPLTVREGRLLLDELLRGKDKDYLKGLPVNTDVINDISNQVNSQNSVERLNLNEDSAVEVKEAYVRDEKNGPDILRGLNLKIKRGTLNCLLGGNGSGKSTLLKAIIGIVKLQRGSISMGKEEKIALVPQEPQSLFTEITVEEEMYEGMAFMDLTQEEKIARTNHMLNLMGIEHLRKSNPYDLSGGEQQRLAIGKVMTYGPTVLLLDEPTKGLDPFFKTTLGKILNELKEEGTTIFMVSHDIDFCATYGDICSMFFDGEISTTGLSHEFFRGNSFYTTTANKLTRKWRDDLILSEEVRAWLHSMKPL